MLFYFKPTYLSDSKLIGVMLDLSKTLYTELKRRFIYRDFVRIHCACQEVQFLDQWKSFEKPFVRWQEKLFQNLPKPQQFCVVEAGYLDCLG